MAAFFDPSSGSLHHVSDDRILELLGDGTESDIEEFHDEEELEAQPSVFADIAVEDDHSEVSGGETEPESVSQVIKANRELSRSPISRQIGSRGRSRGHSRGTSSQRMQSRRERPRTATANRRNQQQHGHGDTWKNIPFIDKPHNYRRFNRIPDRAACRFKPDPAMVRGETQHYTRDSTVIVKWKDNKSVIMASNCTGSSCGTTVKRWDKKQGVYIDVPAPKIIQQYNQHMGGVDILDQQMEYYRTFIKTRKWTLKVIIHFLDLALVNSWRLYKNDCVANDYSRKDILMSLDFRLSVADALTNYPDHDRDDDVNIDSENEPPPVNRQYRPIRPSQGKRYDGYDHLAVFDDTKAPRSCMMERCHSRSKIKCSKCDVYLYLSGNQNCFQLYHVKP